MEMTDLPSKRVRKMQDLRFICLLLASAFIVTGSGCTLTKLTAHDSPSSFTSSGYPIKFHPSICQTWLIRAQDRNKRVVLETVDFKLPPDNQTHVTIFDTDGADTRLLGTDRVFYESKGFTLNLELRTYDKLFTRGFKFNYYQVSAGAPCSREIEASFSGGFLDSPGYPYGYFNNLQCNYTIRPKYPGYRLSVASWDIAIEDSYRCQYDSLTFIDFIDSSTREYVVGRTCGNEQPAFHSSGSVFKIMFITNHHKTNKGFRIRFLAMAEDRMNVRTRASRLDSFLISPGYPHSGAGNISVNWNISSNAETVELSTVDCDLPASEPNCTGHSVEVSGVFPMAMNGSQELNETSRSFDTRFCGNSTPSFSSEKHTRISLVSTSSLSGSRGLVMKHRLKEEPLVPVVCGGNLSASNMTQNQQSPDYPRPSLQNQTCTWTVTATEASDVIVLSLIDLDIDMSEDSFKLYDGALPVEGKLLERWQGQRAGEYVISPGATLTVVYTLDDSDNGRGVSFNYTAVEVGQVPSIHERKFTVEAKLSSSYLSSPGFMIYSPRNTTLYITFKADESLNVRVEFLSSNLDGTVLPSGPCSHSSLFVYDGPSSASALIAGENTDSSSVCGRQEPVFISSGSYLHLVYKVGLSGYKDRGFLLTYREDDPTALNVERNCGGKLVATSQNANFTSPRYPLNYYNGLSCLWTIIPSDNTSYVLLEPVDIHIESSAFDNCNYDSLIVLDGAVDYGPVIPKIVATMCGNKGTQVQSSVRGGGLTVVFSTDQTNSDKGFLLDYVQTDEPPPCDASSKVLFTPYQYKTPGYALNTIPANTSCTWLLYNDYSSSHIMVDIKSNSGMTDVVNDSCTSFHLDLYDGNSENSLRIDRLCGKIEKTYISSGNNMFIKLVNGDQPVPGGYTITFRTTSEDVCGTSYLTAYESASVLTSPYYPKSYPSNTECLWYINAPGINHQVVIEVVSMDMDDTEGCGKEYLIAYDSYSTLSPFDKWCGKKMPTYQSTGGSISIKFHSSNALSTPKTGFKLKYWTKYVPWKSGADVNVGAIIGGIIGGIAFIALIFVVIFCVTQKPFSKKPILSTTGPSYPVVYQAGQHSLHPQPQLVHAAHSNPNYASSDSMAGSNFSPADPPYQNIAPSVGGQSDPTFTKL